MKISVTGSLGNISKPLTKILVKNGHEVTVITSKADKQAEIESLGAKAAVGSLEDAEFLAITFADADAVYCMVPPNFSETDQVKYYRRIAENYVAAVKKSGVKRVVDLSSWGAHRSSGTGIILGSHNLEQALNTLSDVAVTHLRAGSIFYNIENFSGMIRHLGFIAANYGEGDQIAWVHPEDIAEAAAEELTAKKPAGNDVRYVVSDEKTAAESAKIIGEAIGIHNLEWRRISDEEAAAGMAQSGMPNYMIPYFVDLNASIRNGTMAEHYLQNKPEKLGKRKLADYSKEFAKIYKNA